VISIVDDDESVRASTKTLLRSVGYEVEAFVTAEDLLNSDALGKTECLILDVRMPGIDGLELQRRLQADGHRIPIIFITSYDNGPLRRRAMECGAVDMLHKPFDAAVFLATVQTALRSISSLKHIPFERLRELAAPSLVETGYFEVTSVLTPEESTHFRECSECIDALANIVRKIIGDRERKKSAGNESG
jgi:DNA-binding response OmpR family regulator